MLQKNITIFQFFHWYYTAEGNLWCHVKEKASEIAALGMTHVWLPPAYKSAKGIEEPGYAVYDLYDLGEFDQKGTVRTRHGTKEEYLDCIQTLKDNGIHTIADIVLNHKIGADETEQVPARQVNPENRNEISPETVELTVHSKFTFPGRGNKYSDFIWDWNCFSGIKQDENIYLLMNEYAADGWDMMQEDELGNFDYLMGADIEFRNPYVMEELKKWGEWYVNSTGVTGFRLDAVKHIPHYFFSEWIDHLRNHFRNPFFFVGEYWRRNVEVLLKYLDAVENRLQLFDVPLHFNFHEASLKGSDYDLRCILDNSLVQRRPECAITFVDNHDTQPLQSLESFVEYWFQPAAYAIILLREQGIPCVFYPSLYEAKYVGNVENEQLYIELNTLPCIEKIVLVRRWLAYGPQEDYFVAHERIGWVRSGTLEHPHSGLAVVVNNGDAGSVSMQLGPGFADTDFVNVCGDWSVVLRTDAEGRADFYADARSTSVWIRQSALEYFK